VRMIELDNVDAAAIEFITTPCPGTCVLMPCGSPDCNTLLVNQIQPWPSIQCPHCAWWMMGPEELEAEFRYPLNLARSHPIVCPACKGDVLLTRTFEPRYHVEKVEDAGDGD